VGARAPEGRPWGHISTLFAVIQKRVLKINLDQSMLKNAYFLEKKTVKIASASGARPQTTVCFCSQTLALLLQPTITTLSSSFLALNAGYYQI